MFYKIKNLSSSTNLSSSCSDVENNMLRMIFNLQDRVNKLEKEIAELKKITEKKEEFIK